MNLGDQSGDIRARNRVIADISRNNIRSQLNETAVARGVGHRFALSNNPIFRNLLSAGRSNRYLGSILGSPSIRCSEHATNLSARYFVLRSIVKRNEILLIPQRNGLEILSAKGNASLRG